MLNCIFL